jgi:hypothetical protein
MPQEALAALVPVVQSLPVLLLPTHRLDHERPAGPLNQDRGMDEIDPTAENTNLTRDVLVWIYSLVVCCPAAPASTRPGNVLATG